jgi:hypothetical protein
MTQQQAKKKQRYDRSEWQSLADCIRMDQLSAREVYEVMSRNPEFQRWYRQKYIKR